MSPIESYPLFEEPPRDACVVCLVTGVPMIWLEGDPYCLDCLNDGEAG